MVLLLLLLLFLVGLISIRGYVQRDNRDRKCDWDTNEPSGMMMLVLMELLLSWNCRTRDLAKSIWFFSNIFIR